MKKTVRATCHCGSVELELTLPNGLEKLRRCNCSMCRRRNAVVASVTLENLKIINGASALKTDTFNTHAAKHYFSQTAASTPITKGALNPQSTVSTSPVLKASKLRITQKLPT